MEPQWKVHAPQPFAFPFASKIPDQAQIQLVAMDAMKIAYLETKDAVYMRAY